MVKPKPPPLDTTPITSFMHKRKSDGKSIASPTGETASPEKQKQKATESTTAESNAPTPREVSPQRDKILTPKSSASPVKNPYSGDNKDKDVKMTESKSETVPRTVQNNGKGTTSTLERSNFPPLTESERESKARKQSLLQESFLAKAKAAQSKPAPLLPQWKAHRLACMFTLQQPENNNERITAIATELNKMLIAVKSFTEKVFVRKFVEHFTPRQQERKLWISQFDKSKASDLLHYTHGFLAWVAPRGGVQRLLVQVVLPVATNISDMLFDVNNSSWASKNGRRLYDIKEQALYSPKPVGWLFRSNHVMASSDELQLAMERRGRINFGLTFKTVPVPGQKYNKETAVKAVCVSTNEGDVETAWRLLSQWYNAEKPIYPLSIPMVFVPCQSHPHIHNNPHAAKNISTLLERQKIFINDTISVPCPVLAAPDECTPTPGKRTLRHLLMDVTVTTMGEEYLGAKLFHAISKKSNPNGNTEYFFTFHRAVEKEARSVISGLSQFIKSEWKINPDQFCYAHMLDDTQKWNRRTRCLSNPTTTFLDKIAMRDAEDNEDGIPPVGELFTMNEKQRRESRRILGLKDDETVNDVTKKQKPARHQRDDDTSQVSEISGLTQYSTASAASKERKKLRSQIDAKTLTIEAQAAEIAKLRADLQKCGTADKGQQDGSSSPSSQASSQSSTGEQTSESPPISQPDGWEKDPNYDTDDSPPARKARQKKSIVDLSHETTSESENSDEVSESEYYDAEGYQIPYLGSETGNIDGLEFIYRGAPLEIKELRKQYIDDPYPLIETDEFNFDTDLEGDSWVELYRVKNRQLFSKTIKERRQSQSDRDRCVRFANEAKMMEFDHTGSFSEEKEVDIDNESIISEEENKGRMEQSEEDTDDPTDGYNSDEQLDARSNTSDSSTQSEIPKTVLSPTQSMRPSSITTEILHDACKATKKELTPTNTDGGGPEKDV